MAGRKVWLTWLPSGEDAPTPQEAVQALGKVGLDVAGAPFVDDLQKCAYSELATQLNESEKGEIELWVVAGRQADFEKTSIRYALGMVSAMVRDVRDPLPLLWVVGLDFEPKADALPTFLRGANVIDGTSGKWPAKVFIGSHNKKGGSVGDDFRFNVIAHPYIGQWFEIGPRGDGTWKGAMVGVTGEGVEITQHAVGKKHELPERTVLNYASEGIKAQIGDDEYVAWSVQNEIGNEESYYVRVVGHPNKVIIGEHPAEDEADAWTLALA